MIRLITLSLLIVLVPPTAVFAENGGAAGSAQESRPDHAPVWQWMGSSVTADETRGNWVEGLTGYLSDHAAAERDGRGPEFRKQLLLDYMAGVNGRKELSLREFRSDSQGPAARAAGYGKAVMVFHMLEKQIGSKAFSAGLGIFAQDHRNRPATWDDIRTAMEKASGKNLGSFFEQWINRPGMPELEPGEGEVTRTGDDFSIELQGLRPGSYTLDVPAWIEAAGGERKQESLSLDGDKPFSLLLAVEPRRLVMDPGYDIARLPSPPETPALIGTALAAEHPLVVMPAGRQEAYRSVAARFRERGGSETPASDITTERVRQASALVVLGSDNPALETIFGTSGAAQAGFSMHARKNPWNKRGIVLVIDAESAAEAEAALPRIEADAGFSAVAYSRGSRIFAETDDSSKGVAMDLRQEPVAIDLSRLKTLPDAITAAAAKRIVYVGEYHDKFEHHAAQLEVIKGLFAKDRRLAIGMEMFQRPFQSVLEDYIAGKIGEREFLRKSEYFKRWGFDYNLYKPILDYGRENRIPVIALNQKGEIVEKVARSGLDSLTGEEKKAIPAQMDFSDDAYRERLKAAFGRHPGASDRSFDYFYQAQVLWDETMAQSVDEYLKKHPDDRMVVIAGSGHIAYGSGIPKRCFRRNSLPYFIAVNDGELDREAADYLILPGPLQGATAPKLMVLLEVRNSQVLVQGFPDDSISKRAGIRAGDEILALDGEPVKSVEDVKLALFYRKQGDVLEVRVRRKGFLFGEKTLEIGVKL